MAAFGNTALADVADDQQQLSSCEGKIILSISD
jgi:hypothetical protein